MKHSFLPLLFLASCALSAQFESPFGKGAEFLGMGNGGVASVSNYSMQYNHSGLAWIDEWSVNVQAARLFDDSGILHLHTGFVYPTQKFGAFGFRAERYGLDGYSFQNYSMAYARKLHSNFSMSVAFNLYQFAIEGYGNSFTPNVEIGMLTQLTDEISLGMHLANPFPLRLSQETALPTIFSAGIQYQINALVKIVADVEKNIKETQNFKFGVEYQIHQILALRAGINTLPGSFFFGVSLLWKNIKMDIGNGYHQILGNSIGLGVVYRKPAE
ncbi:PorV/PorQ family protein [Portibacter marinus]|uniref:hypothetical protein n=1 Tax=Portibacter marinus TaxID=2898660 RepID=UPI001F2719C8|nr:hypothetical protein [Portibacter marinus]